MNTQDLINQAKQDNGVHCDGYRQFSSTVADIQCEIITRSHHGTYRNKFADNRPDTTRIQFWHNSTRISRAAADIHLKAKSELEEWKDAR